MGLFGFGKKKQDAPSQPPGPAPSTPPAQNIPTSDQHPPVEPLQMQTQTPPLAAGQEDSSQLFAHPVQPVQQPVSPVPSTPPPAQPAPAQAPPQMDFSVPDFSDDDLNLEQEPQAAHPVQPVQQPVSPVPSTPPPAQPAPAQEPAPVQQSQPEPLSTPSTPPAAQPPQMPSPQTAPVEPSIAPSEESVNQQLDELSSAIEQGQDQSGQEQSTFTQEPLANQASEEVPVELGESSVSEPVNPTEIESGEEFGLEQAAEDEPEDDGMGGLSFAQDHDLSPILPAQSPSQDTIPQETTQQVQFSNQQSAPEVHEKTVPYDEPEPIDGKVFVQKNRDRTNVFVEKDAYEEALLSMMSIEEDVTKAADHLGRVIDDESIVSARMSEWHDVMNEIQERLITVDSRIFDVGDTNG